MAIAYDQMPEAYQQTAIQIFADQLNGIIDDAEANRRARANEAAAEQAVAAGATGGSFLLTPPASADGGTTGGGTTGGGDGAGSTQPSGETCNGIAKPTTSLRRGWEWYCNPEKGWDARWIGEGPEPTSKEEEDARWTEAAEEDDPMTDPSRIPTDAPDGYFYEWNGTRWVLRRDADVASDFAMQQARESAMDVIARRLETYGLGSLADFVWNLITQENITSEYALIERIRETDQYKQRFPAMKMRRDRNLNAISEQEYIDLENSYRETMQLAGMPRGLFDGPEDFTSLITGDVSPKELQQRVQAGYQAVAQSNPQVINEMKRLYGVDDSMLAAYFLDPERATPMLLRQAQSAQIAAEATLQAEMGITAGTAEQLAVAGVTQEQARAGFQAIQAGQELFVSLPGTTEAAIAQEEQIAGIFGTSSAAQQRIRQRTRERQAIFEAGGRFAGQGTTVTGLQ
jgi:hypothetical protein